MKIKHKEPPFTIVNGKKRYSFRCEVQSEFRPPVPPAQVKQPLRNEENAETSAEASNQSGEPGDEVVRTRVRVLSSVYTWSGTYFGPQLVHNGWNDNYALRKVAQAINARTGNKAVPVVWDHSLEAHDICGRLVNGAWEDSTDIPPGVNSDIEVFRDVDPRAAALIDQNMLPATSVWWTPEQEPSHPNMSFEEFIDRQGEVVDGEVVCWRPVDLTDTGLIHHAIVWAGADPYSGPREEQGARNAAIAAPHTNHSEGDRGMEEDLRKMVEAIANALSINVAVGPGSAIPDTLQQSLTNGIAALRNTQTKYNELASKLQGLGPALEKEGEATLCAADILNRLPERIEMAKHGDSFLQYQQETAVAWHDKAKVDPANPQNMSDVDKRERERIANCTNLDELEDKIAIYKAEAKARFGPSRNMRSSMDEELQSDEPISLETSIERAQMTAMVNHMFRRGGKANG